MLPDPLHPAIVHLPLGIAFVLPLVAIFLFAMIERGLYQPRTWAIVLLLQALLCGGIFLAQETGEDQEERVEQVAGHENIETHADRAELFEIFGYVALGISALGLFGGKFGTIVRSLLLVLSLAVAVAGALTGMAGGELVYKHGAASVYVTGPSPAAGNKPAEDPQEHK